MKKSKIITKVLCLSMSFCMLLGSSSFAKTPDSQVLIENKEIKNVEELSMRARQGINDFDISKLPEDLAKSKFIVGAKNGNKKISETHVTSQLLKKVKNGDTTVEEYSVTFLSDITPMSSGTISDEQWDDSLSVRAYSTIYFTKASGPDTIILNRCTGGWQISDKTVNVSGRLVRYGTAGIGPTGYVQQSQEKNPTTNTFDYTTGFTKTVFVSPPAGGSWTAPIVGVHTECTLKRGTSSVWSIFFTNNY